jgi:two-component system, cell cycle sensor histidine kinase and response regulator CckA
MTTPRPLVPSIPGADLPGWQPEPDASGGESGPTVLLVDDEEAVRKVARRVLERSGFSVLATGSPLEAIELFGLHRDRIDLLLTDVTMPVMNGRDLADALLCERPDLPVLFMTGHSYDALRERVPGEPRISLLHKPFGPDELNRAVRGRLAAPGD